MPRPAMRPRRQNSFNKHSPKRRGAQPDAASHREYLQKKLAKVAIGNKPENSDDSDGIVTSRPNGRNRKKVEVFASGAVAKGDKPGAFPTRAQRTRALRGDTEEIMSQRSRSQSRTRSVASAQDPMEPVKENVHSAKRRKVGISDTTMNSASKTQVGDSILGAIKPRKRQNSILETMGIGIGLDSSTIHSDDEDQFLPDEISTPAQDIRLKTTKTSSSLKRKREATDTNTQARNRSSSSLSSLPSRIDPPEASQPDLPRPSRSQQKKLNSKPISRVEDDVMAPPESSDSEDAAEEPQMPSVKSPNVRKSKSTIVSTRQLQALMPSKREKPVSVSLRQDEFEIRIDSTSQSDEEDDQSTFSPVKTRKSQKRRVQASKATKTAVKPAGPKIKSKGGKSTSNLPNTPSPTRLRTPLPLSSSKPRGSEAKSTSKQDMIMRDRSTNTPLPSKGTRGEKKRYGGSRRREAGKENQPTLLSDEPYGSDASVTQAKVEAARIQADGPEIKAWTKKWANIDDFELEFEDVSASTRSSSPHGMSR